MNKDISILFSYKSDFNFEHEGYNFSGYTMLYIFLKEDLFGDLYKFKCFGI